MGKGYRSLSVIFALAIINILILTKIKIHKYKKVIVFRDVKPYDLVAVYINVSKKTLAGSFFRDEVNRV